MAEVFSGAASSLAEADANERLIAAAPDLLHACRELLEAVEELSRDPHMGDSLREGIERGRSAIAKAEGAA